METSIVDLERELAAIPLIDPHSHIDPLSPTSKSLDDILGYHYYTELAHSAGMSKALLSPEASPMERCREILRWLPTFENTAQASWLLDICRTFLGFRGENLEPDDADPLFDRAVQVFAGHGWEEQVFMQTNLEAIFLTNEFDDPLEGFDTGRYIPCLRTDTLVFRFDDPDTRQRLAHVTGVEVHDLTTLGSALDRLFERFLAKGARACAISLPPDFTPADDSPNLTPQSIFWKIAERCRTYRLPFDLMIGVNRNVYQAGVHQGRDLFDQRTSLMQFASLFNAFPEVIFPVSVLTSAQNQELVSFAWIFPNVVTNGHWWYSNIPGFIERDLLTRLQAVPGIKQIGYYSDAYRLEFVLPKYRMYRRILARTLVEQFVSRNLLSEMQALELGRKLLRGNIERIFPAVSQ